MAMIEAGQMQQAAATIQRRRKALGLSRAALAAESGVSESTIKGWETNPGRDIRRPGMTQLPNIVDTLARLERDRAAAYTEDGAGMPTAYRDPDTDAVVVMLNYLPPEQRRRVIEQAMALIVDAIGAGHRGTAD